MDNSEAIKKMLSRKVEHPYPENMQLGRACAADGMVLLKNENDVLPLRGKKIALFGSGATDTITCGTGSGYAPAPYIVNVREGLTNAGYELTSSLWLDRFCEATKKANDEDTTLTPTKRYWSGVRILLDDMEIAEEELDAATEADTAVYIIRRNAGENDDRKAVEGDYYLTGVERNNLELLAARFSKVVVVLNTCVMDANFIDEIPGLQGLLLMGLAGNESGNALADVLSGKVCPSGKLTDTWARNYSDYPASETFGMNDGDALQEDYREDIYVGYRFFDTYKIEPKYPFGYGLSYTAFAKRITAVDADWRRLLLSVQVTNKGACAGKDVTQVYVTAPEGRLNKPFQELCGFSKTGLLEPGESEMLEISIPMEFLSSYDTQTASFIMEKGDYLIRVGEHSRETGVAAVIRLDRDAVLRRVSNKMNPDRPLSVLQGLPLPPENTDAPVLMLLADKCHTVDGASRIEHKITTFIPEGTSYQPGKIGENFTMPFPCEEEVVTVKASPESTLIDVKEGRVSMEEFVASLDPEVLCRLVAGDANETPYSVPSRLTQRLKPNEAIKSSGGTTALFVETLGIPNCLMTDGPAGLHVIGGATTSYPVGMVMAQTWDEKYCEKVGRGMGKELEHHNYSVILGPGMNIHRDPLCGRNFEYYSEDPLISGKMGAAVTRGVQSIPGCCVSIKHFACNNQEADRTITNSTVTERALREIYLKGFEICVRESSPATVMTAYNKINGIYSSSHYELLTEILRGEWGFDGLVMTDWGTSSNKVFDLHAGNHLIMGGYRSQYLMAALTGKKPDFSDNGSVKEEILDIFGGFMQEHVQSWNSFEPDRDGKDSVSVEVKAGIGLGENVKSMIDADAAFVETDINGNRIVTYRGTDRGAYLKLGELQKCASAVLKSLMNSSAYMNMVRV